MRRVLWSVFVLLCLTLGAAAEKRIELSEWLICEADTVNMPVFSDQKDTQNKKFDAAALQAALRLDRTENQALRWRTLKTTEKGLNLSGKRGYQLYLLRSYLKVNRWTKGALLMTVNGLCEVLVDGKSVFTRKSGNSKEERIEMALTNGTHEILIRALLADSDLFFKADFVPDKEFSEGGVVTGVDTERTLTIHDVLEGRQLVSALISPSGRYLLLQARDLVAGSGKDRGYRSIYDLNTRRNIMILRSKEMADLSWLPSTDRLSYTLNFDGKKDLYIYDFLKGQEQLVVAGLKNLSQYSWAPGEDRIVFSQYNEADKPGELKRIYGVEDRLPYFRNRSTLHLIDVASGQQRPLTAGHLSADFHEFCPDGSRILFSTSRMDYSEIPFRRQNLYEMDLGTMMLRTLWQDKLYGASVSYSPDGRQLLVSGGPETFGDVGVKVRQGRIPNSFDGQIYIMDLATLKVDAVSRDFDPAISSAYWSRDGQIYLSVTQKDFGRLYRYNPVKKLYQNLPLSEEVLRRIDYDRTGRRAVYTGSGVNSPQKLYLIDLKTTRSQLIDFPGRETYSSVRFGKTTTWDFVNKTGDTISGRVYYPVDFQEDKIYPLIVNYYGGTSPVERSFGGRYPLETWAAAGYLVYVLQPSGAIGFGQDFSALHVNGWGFDAIDDIIDGTRAFLKAHPMADVDNIGCIGASYGGYTTMLLQTRTDIFKTAISHAGISSITSYWGEGYWGYTYNTGAAKGSYPWNRRDIYVDNSPVYNADKFNNSILLLHGTDDTNVPVGESLQYYAALKLLGKDVEMVLVEGQNHHILDYSKRIKWHHTIMSWFDKKLKNQPQQWEQLYPEKNY